MISRFWFLYTKYCSATVVLVSILLLSVNAYSQVLSGTFDSHHTRYAENENFNGVITQTWSDTAWKRERLHQQILLWPSTSGATVWGIDYTKTDLLSANGNTISSDAIRFRFVRDVKGDATVTSPDPCVDQDRDSIPEPFTQVADALSTTWLTNVGPNSTTGVDLIRMWVTVDIPSSTVADEYTGTVTATVNGQPLVFTMNIDVVDNALPGSDNWLTHLDLWQYPERIQNLHNLNSSNDIDIWSDEHFDLLEPLYKNILADAGQKVITAHMKEDVLGGPSMVDWDRTGGSGNGEYPAVGNPWEGQFYYVENLITTGGLDNISYTQSAFPSGGYVNHTGSRVRVSAGDQFSVQLEKSSSCGTFKVWIDWNGDGDFNDTLEGYASEGSVQNCNTDVYSFNVDVPQTAVTGTTRMRVQLKDSWVAVDQPPVPMGDANHTGTADFELEIINGSSSDNSVEVWTYDFTNFNKYVNKLTEWGISKQISAHIGGFIPNTLIFNEGPGVQGKLQYCPNDSANAACMQACNADSSCTLVSWSEYSARWNHFFTAFKAHLDSHGWFDKTVLYLDEVVWDQRPPWVDLISAHNSNWKIGMSIAHGGYIQADLEPKIYDLSTILVSNPEITPANRNGKVTTFYTSCSQAAPNSFVTPSTDPADMVWNGWYMANTQYDGFLRWAFDNWTRESAFDVRDRAKTAGDFSMVYWNWVGSSMEVMSSIRFELLREGLQDREKIRSLNESLAGTAELITLNDKVAEFAFASGETAVANRVAQAQQLLDDLVSSSGDGLGSNTATSYSELHLSGASGSEKRFQVDVPAGASNLMIKIFGGTGDADMYVKADSAPTTTSYDCRHHASGNDEHCAFSNPVAGTYHVMLVADSSYSGVSLEATWQ